MVWWWMAAAQAGDRVEVAERPPSPSAAIADAPEARWETPPIASTPPRSPLPWVVAGIGGSLAIVGAGMAAPGWDPDAPMSATGTRTALAGASVGLGGLLWGVVREAAARPR